LATLQSKDTVIANLTQQVSGVLLLLTIPNLLSVEHYAQVVIIAVVLSFTRFSDLGLSSVYGRDAPRHYSAKNTEKIQHWNRTLFWLGILGGCIAGGVAAVVMYVRFGNLLYATLVALMPVMIAVTSTHVTMAGARSDFRSFRNNQVSLSLSRLISIPLAHLLGLFGWLTAQVVSYGFVAARLGVSWVPRPPEIDWTLVRRHLPAALQLALVSLLWAQLLDSGRLMAAFFYPPEGIAQYGILTTGYQSAFGLIISAFLPVSVKTLGLFGESDRSAADYMFSIVYRTIPVVFILAIIGAEMAPWVIDLVFPKYRIDPMMPKIILYGLTVLPFIATIGNLYIGKHRNYSYLAILCVSMAVTVGIEHLLRPEIGIKAAAVAQTCGTFLLALLMLVVGCFLFADVMKANRRKILSSVAMLAGMWTVYLSLKFIPGWI
jgi:hypothetical protein